MKTYTNKLTSISEAQEIIEAELKLMETLEDYWCATTGRDTVDHTTITIVFSYVERFGMSNVLSWIRRANNRTKAGADDLDMGRYISGIVRHNSNHEYFVESFEDLVNRAK